MTRERAESLAIGACVSGSLLGAVVLLGWRFDIEFLKRIFPGMVTMKVATAAGMLLQGISSAIICAGKATVMRQSLVIPMALSTAILVVSGMTGVLAFDDGGLHSTAPGVPSIGTALCFALLMEIDLLFLFSAQWARYSWTFCWAVILVSFAAIWGYAIDLPALYYLIPGVSTAMAFHTAIGFLVLGIAHAVALAAKTEELS